MHAVKLWCTALCMLLASALPALADAAGGEAHGDWANTAWRVANLILFIAVIRHFFGKKIAAFFKGRSEGIAAELAALEAAKAEAARKLEEVEKRIAGLEQERLALTAEYRAQGETLRAAIIAGAEEEAKRIAAGAQTTAENEIKAAVEAVRAELAEAIVTEAEKMLAERLTARDHAELVDKYLAKVVFH
ncbi:MAG: F0F1 ATP synthase subunit B [Desulfovibrio sp.]|nr:F0F1 ATP synthase subunit B [Desulfovibrio sp.]